MRYVYLVFFTLLLVLGWIFGVQNAPVLGYPVALKLQLWLVGIESLPMPLGAYVVLAFFAGSFLAMIFLMNHAIHLKREISRRKSDIRNLEKEISNLRKQAMENVPNQLQDAHPL